MGVESNADDMPCANRARVSAHTLSVVAVTGTTHNTATAPGMASRRAPVRGMILATTISVMNVPTGLARMISPHCASVSPICPRTVGIRPAQLPITDPRSRNNVMTATRERGPVDAGARCGATVDAIDRWMLWVG